MTCFATSLLRGWVGGRGVLLGNLGGGVPHGTPNPALISRQKCYSPHPFSDLASNIISSLSDQKLFRLERQHKIHSEFACYRSFLYLFGIETTERLKLSQSSLQTNMCEVYIGIPFSDRNDTNTIPFGAAQTSIWLIQESTPGGGGYFRNFWVGMCRWDPGTLNLY